MDKKTIIEIKEKVKGYVNAADLWHLLDMGAPDDEYNSYIDRIVSLVVNQKLNQANMESELYEIFKTKEFELEKDKIKELASKIIRIIGWR